MIWWTPSARSPRQARQFCLLVIIAAGVCVSAAPVQAQWTVSILNPASTTYSDGVAISGTQQGGTSNTSTGTTIHATMWSGTASSLVDIHPAAASGSWVTAVSDTQQAGYVYLDAEHASLWSGSAASWVDLSPPGASRSVVFGMSGVQQVGWAAINGPGSRAVLWNSTAASWVDLNPPGATFSIAHATDGTQQVGEVHLAGVLHPSAALWSGSAQSFVNLGAAQTRDSVAFGVGGGQQVGYVNIAGSGSHASLWTGTAASWVDLTPPGSLNSVANAVSGGLQVGYASFVLGYVSGQEGPTTLTAAVLWSGTARSHVNLHAFLPEGVYESSNANGVWTNGTTTRVVGTAYELATGHPVSILWTRTCSNSNCPADVDCSGTVNVSDIFAFLNDWFARDPSADFNHVDGVTVQDIFDFLNAWFAGC